MRCPKCGAENAPDSRFCGVCGLPQAQAQAHAHAQQQRLAPTTKIPDDAPFAPPTRQVAPITPVAGVSYSPPSMPPQNVGGLAPPQQAGLTTRPGGHAAPPRTGDHANVRPSGDYQPVRPSGLAPGRQSFDSITPTGRQERMPMPLPSGQRSLSNAPMASNPSMSFSAAPHRPLGLIAIVLVFDLGLAGAGAFLLAKGMSKPKAEKTEKAPDKKSELSTPAPAAAAVAPAPATAVVAAPPATAASITAGPMVAPAAPDAARVETTATAAARSKTPRSPTTAPAATAPSGPVTSPSATASAAPPRPTVPGVGTPEATTVQPLSTAAQIDTLANQSTMAFERCRGDQAPTGAITVAFNVQPDGTVTNHQTVANTTGNSELGACLARVIGGWRVSPFQGNTMSFMRPFNYP